MKVSREEMQKIDRELKENGYRWEKYQDPFTDEKFWQLWSPDRRVVTLEQALDEIRGTNIVEQAIAEIKAEEEAEEAKQAEQEEVDDAFHSTRDFMTERMTEVEPFDYGYFKVMFSNEVGRILSGQVRRVDCVVSERRNPDDSFRRFYCKNPDEANLEPVTGSTTVADFFG